MNLSEIKTTAPPQIIWQAWEKAHAIHTNQGVLEKGGKGKTERGGARGFKYKILNVEQGESFSILWRSYLAKLLFHYRVIPQKSGSLLQYGFEIKGPFAWPLRWILGKKIQSSLSSALKSFVKQIESKVS